MSRFENHVDMDELVGRTFEFYGAHSEKFMLDGRVYQAIEDENDGYRSALGHVCDLGTDATHEGFFALPVATVRVERVLDSYFDTWKFVDVVDGHEWLEVGTNNHEDYYPSFLFRYQPKEST